MAWTVFSSLSVYPYSSAHFNELVGGSENGHRHLINSNLDWGHNLLHMKMWLDRHPHARPFYFAYSMPLVDPAIAGIVYERPPTWQQLGEPPAMTAEGGEIDIAAQRPTESRRLLPGWYAIDTNALHHRDGGYAYFKSLDPVDCVAYSIFIYHLSPQHVEAIEAAAGGRRD